MAISSSRANRWSRYRNRVSRRLLPNLSATSAYPVKRRPKEKSKWRMAEATRSETHCKRTPHCSNPFRAIRYHSLVIYRDNLPDCLEITAWTEDGTIMGLKHRQFQVEGVQFHPESFMTDKGKDLLRNFLAIRRNNYD